MMTTVSN